MTKNNFHNTLLSAIAEQDKEIGNHFEFKELNGASEILGLEKIKSKIKA